jgi:Protein of unknown function (DUF3617)
MKKMIAFALLLSGCAQDPASEPPVELQPGLYQVAVGGGTVVRLPSDQRSDQICLSPPDAIDFAKSPLYPTIGVWDGCSETSEEPKGNAISGKRECLDRKTPMTAAFAGSHTADTFEIRGTVAQGSDENSSVMRLGSGDFSITGKRIGDCTA